MRKWYSLIDKVYALENLHQAFKHVKSNNGAPRIDEGTVEDFAMQLEEKLNMMHVELKTDTYEPSPVKRVEIDKEDGGKRPLGIPTVTDRVVQQALRQVIEPIFEPDFHPSSYGYRPNRSCQKAVAKAEQFLRRYGLTHIVGGVVGIDTLAMGLLVVFQLRKKSRDDHFNIFSIPRLRSQQNQIVLPVKHIKG